MEYKDRIHALQAQLENQKTIKSRIAAARLAVLLLAILAGYNLYKINLPLTFGIVVLLMAVFIRLVYRAADNKAAIDNSNRLLNINKTEIEIADGNFKDLPSGLEWLPAVHDYAHDLDIFGRASLYQYISRSATEHGNKILAGWLLAPADAHTAKNRQQAARELAPMLEWRQQLQSHAQEERITINTATKIRNWVTEPNVYKAKSFWKILRIAYPLITISWLLLYIFDFVPAAFFYGSVILLIGISALVTKRIHPQYSMLNKIVPEVSVLSKVAAWIESMDVKSSELFRLRAFFLTGNKKASHAISQLKQILDRFDYRLNPLVFVPLNAMVLWDLQLIFQLENWRDANKANADKWFEAVGEMEALSSLATVHYNHKDWAFPQFDTTSHGHFEAIEMGHPLIRQTKRVDNDFATKGTAKIALITGSNMAGKSTFLRSAGVNLVLAMCGAPVCAKSMTNSPMKVISSMRIADNLEENTSTFYAELKKLKYIIEAVNRKEKIFLLLDEMLRGTNSLDRHTGSKALIKQLIEHEAVGMVATHDVELAELVKEYPRAIDNFHFDAQVENEELYFDYKLKKGVCQSLNASILMKKIGIEL